MPTVSVIQHQDDAPLDDLVRGLRDVRLDIIRPDQGEALPDLDRTNGLIVLGGSMSAGDDQACPWLPSVRNLLSAAVDRGLPALGICLGAQMLAMARGGSVQTAAPTGPERGVIEVLMRPDAAADPVLGPVVEVLGRVVPAPSLHADAITALPGNATWLAASRAYPYQAFRIGSALGVQFHPEVSAERLVQWIEDYDDEDPVEVAAQWKARAAELATVADTLGQAFAAQVRAAAYVVV